MSIINFIAGRFILSLLLAWLFIPASHSQDTVLTENYARNVDKAALSAQEKAIASLSRQLQKKRGTIQEADFLIRVAELQIQKSAILFRISIGKSHAAYEKSIGESIKTLSEYLSKFQSSGEFPEVLFSRAKCYGEIQKKSLAKQDYLRLIHSYPQFPMLDVARMAVAEIEIADANHPAAVVQLHAIEKNSASAYYPFALYKLAWSYLNLKEFVKASEYLVKHINHYQGLVKNGTPDLVTSGFIENSLNDLALFYLENLEAKSDGFTVKDALSYFQDIESGPRLGRLLVSFAKLLAAHSHTAELYYWKDKVVESHPKLPESVEVALLTFQYQYAHHNYSALKSSAAALVALSKDRETKQKSDILNALSAIAADLQALVLKNKDADELSSLTTPLASIYEAVVQIVDERDPRSIQARLNLAETSFQIKDYKGATQHYRWLVENVSAKDFKKSKTDAEKISLLAIASRYEDLKKVGAIPQNLTAVSVSLNKRGELKADLKEWVEWLDSHENRYGSGKKNPSSDRLIELQNFLFEAGRALYAAGEVLVAVKRMEAFAFEYPNSKYAIPSIGLALDTWVQSKDWMKIQTLTHEVEKVSAWKELPFSKKAYEMGADSDYKLIESNVKDIATSEELQTTLSRSEACAVKYKALARSLDCLILAGKTALALKNYEKAEKHLKSVIQHPAATSANISGSLLLLASIKEEKGLHSEAAKHLQAYLEKSWFQKSDRDHLDKVAERFLYLTWMSKDPVAMKSALELKGLCVVDRKEVCERYVAWNAVNAKASESEAQGFFKKAYSGSSTHKSLWALAALKRGKKIPYQDKLVLLNRLGTHWDNVSAEFQLALAHELKSTLPLVVQDLRKLMKAIAPLRADQNAIARRLTLTKDVEQAFSKVMLLPWLEIKTSAFVELAHAYEDFSRELQAIQIPQGLPAQEVAEYRELVKKLVTPFAEKARDIREKSDELIAQSKPAEKLVGGSHD